MTRIAFQTVTDVGSKNNLSKSLSTPYPLKKLRNVLTKADYERLTEIYPNGEAMLWGTTPFRDSGTNAQWQKLSPGDVVLFVAIPSTVTFSATVTYTVHNAAASELVWGKRDDGKTWEFIYFVDEKTRQSIPCATINKLVDYEANYTWRRFIVIGESRSRGVLKEFSLQSTSYFPEVNRGQYDKAVRGLDPSKPLDKKGIALARTEQKFLRNLLFAEQREADCGICGRAFPVDLLIAAHIKKRAKCRTAERLDAKNIVMPLCKLGCDDLYEKNYITVEDGKVVKCMLTRWATAPVKKYVTALIGNHCDYWTPASEKYFQWHNEQCSM